MFTITTSSHVGISFTFSFTSPHVQTTNVTSATSMKKPKASTLGVDTKASQAEGVMYKVCRTTVCQLHHLILYSQVLSATATAG